MVREIVHDTFLLSRKAEKATKADMGVVRDLLDTLKANHERCVGMAANMIGVNKRIIVVSNGPMDMAMINPKITKKDKPFETEEGCLSLTGVRKTTRFEEIEVEYQDVLFRKQKRKFSGWTAQIIQHECDHLEGILI